VECKTGYISAVESIPLHEDCITPGVIIAHKNPYLSWLIYRTLVLRQLRSSFYRVNLRQVAPPPGSDTPPVIAFGNHSAWWDVHVPMTLNEKFWHLDGYLMMEDTQLARYQFFRYAGAFSVNRHDPRAAMESLNYAVQLLTEAPRRALLIFPQGEIRANDHRPLNFFTGAAHIVKGVVRKTGACALYPMALRYEFIGEQRPEAFISVGAPIIVRCDVNGQTRIDAKALTAQMEDALTRELDQLRADIAAYHLESFELLMKGRLSINRWWDSVRGRRQIAEVGRNQNDRSPPQ
jgi:1-acyl-sn-glycerol-3-phosphate acyltransferase